MLSGGTANASNNPSGVTTAYFLNSRAGSGVIMNAAAVLLRGFSVYRAAANTAGSITVYDGLDATATCDGRVACQRLIVWSGNL